MHRFGLLLIILSTIACERAPEPSTATGCLACHDGIESIGENHAFACTACHSGDSTATALPQAHAQLVRNPSAPEHVQRFCGKCHRQEIERLQASKHWTLADAIGQTRFLWGAQDSVWSPYSTLQTLPASKARPRSTAELVDDFLRRKCLTCHLLAPGQPETGLYRASGCAACHVIYDDDGQYRGADRAMQGQGNLPRLHRMTARIPTQQCLHCHNGQHVGADFVGLFEKDDHDAFRAPLVQGREPEIIYGHDHHTLAADVHFRAGMACIDCHGQENAMHGSARASVSCEACHGGFGAGPDSARPVIAQLTGDTLLAPPFAAAQTIAHRADLHRRLRCSACHSRWGFQDYGLHVLRSDIPDYYHREELTLQGDMRTTRFLRRNLSRPMREWQVPALADGITGDTLRGMWYRGFTFRRWENPPLGWDAAGRVAVLRPYQYVVSTIGADTLVWLDSDSTRWAFNPYEPHSTCRARDCEGCHLNPKAVGLGERIFAANGQGAPQKSVATAGLPSFQSVLSIGQPA